MKQGMLTGGLLAKGCVVQVGPGAGSAEVTSMPYVHAHGLAQGSGR